MVIVDNLEQIRELVKNTHSAGVVEADFYEDMVKVSHGADTKYYVKVPEKLEDCFWSSGLIFHRVHVEVNPTEHVMYYLGRMRGINHE